MVEAGHFRKLTRDETGEMKGTDNTNSLAGVLRWREWKIGLSANVKAMFSQILISTDDRPSLRFL